MIYEDFKVSDTDESVLDLSQILMVILRSDSAQSFNTRWDETIITMKKQSDEEILDKLCYCELQQSEQLSHCCLCTCKILFKKVNRETTPDSNKWWSNTWSRQKVRSISLFVKDNMTSSPLALLQPKGKGKRNCGRLRTMDIHRSMLSRRKVWSEPPSREEARPQRNK